MGDRPLPDWAQDRLDHQDKMGSVEGSNADRVGFSLGIFLALAWLAASWLAAAAVIVAVLYLVGKAMGWS